MLIAAAVSATATAFPHFAASSLRLCKLGQKLVDLVEGARYSSMSCEDIYSVIRAESGVYKYYCNGQWLESTSGKSVPVINPTTQEKDYAVQGQLAGGVMVRRYYCSNRCRSCAEHSPPLLNIVDLQVAYALF
jgi:hypothetical protein